MNKYEYLSQLRAGLSSLPTVERDSAMSYYEEFFSDAGEENEQAVIASLGSPQSLAKSIISESSANSTSPESQSDVTGFTPPETARETAKKSGKAWTGGQIALIVILLVLSSPIWIGFVGGAFGVLVGIFAVVFGCLVAFGAVGFIGIISGIITLFVVPTAGIFLLGTGLLFAGLTGLIFAPLCKLTIALARCVINGIVALINMITGKTGVSA